jgi:N-acetylglucosamine-6-phosphate deacetylase
MQVLTGARVFTGDTMLDGCGVTIKDGMIVDLAPEAALIGGAGVTRLPEGSVLASGFIDVQANGAGGVLFNAEPTEATVMHMASTLRRFGGTGVLPTLITDDRGLMRSAAQAVVSASRRPETGILGIHFEGPFISPQKPGVHDPRHIRKPDPVDLNFLCGLPSRIPHGRVLVTLAPEEVEDSVIRRFTEAGIVISAGHSTAGYERIRSAVAHGLRGFTHLFNAMPPFSGRQPGLIAAALTSHETWSGIIVDGIHVHPASLRMALAARGADGFLLVTDAMPPVGTDADGFDLYGRRIIRLGGRLATAEGTLAGADIDMASALRNSIDLLGLTLEEALRMASLNPAKFLKLDDRFGRLLPGYRADLVLLDRNLAVIPTWVAGLESAAVSVPETR